MIGGRLYDSLTLTEVGRPARPRAPLFFQREGQETWGPATNLDVNRD